MRSFSLEPFASDRETTKDPGRRAGRLVFAKSGSISSKPKLVEKLIRNLKFATKKLEKGLFVATAKLVFELYERNDPFFG